MLKNIYLSILRFLIKKYYKSHLLKRHYGTLIRKDLYNDDFALKHGVLEVLAMTDHTLSTKISTQFVKTRFNNIYNRYENDVNEGNYKDGELGALLNLTTDFIQKSNSSLSILDLGCGTGLVGEQLPIDKKRDQIIGVDLSEKMLELCKEKNIYNELSCTDLEQFLELDKRKFDLIYACSVIQFFDDKKLDSLLKKIKPKLNFNGTFIFTFDICEIGYNINEKLYCEHSLQLMQKICAENFNNFKVKKLDFGRFEKNKNIDCGIVVIKNDTE